MSSTCALVVKYFMLAFIASLILVLWFGMNSDRDNVPAFLTQVIPAGHCTCQTATEFRCSDCLDRLDQSFANTNTSEHKKWKYLHGLDNKNIGLSSEQCDAAFPGLFTDPQRAQSFWTAQGGINSHTLDQIPIRPGMARVTIHGGELYIRASRAKGEDHRRKILATLSTMYRSLLAWHPQNEIPEIEFVFSIEDKAEDVVSSECPLWTVARKASEEWLWLMPDFGLWAWSNPDNLIGPYSQVVDRIISDEGVAPRWKDKIPKLVWRGKLSFAPKMRRALLEVARGQAWGDVKPIDWTSRGDFLSMEDHCKYAFIAHVEGRSYSASLKYRQACRSVVIAHKMQWIQHHHYLLVDSGPHQNYVEVERDFSDLPRKIENLIANPSLAERIANNSVSTFRDRYLSQAAEACYWRNLWSSWGAVFVAPNATQVQLPETGSYGLRYESFILLESSKMIDFHS